MKHFNTTTIRQVLATLILALAVLLASALPADACTPTIVPTDYALTPTPSIHDQAADASQYARLIFEGTVIAISRNAPEETAVIAVERYLKGRGPSTVSIQRYGTLCDSYFLSPGTAGIFYANGDPHAPLNYVALFRPDGGVIERVMDTVGQEPVTPERAPVLLIASVVFLTGTSSVAILLFRRWRRMASDVQE